MPSKKLQIKKKSSVVLTPKKIDTVETEGAPPPSGPRKITIRSTKSKLDKVSKESIGAHDNKSATLKVQDDELRFADEEDVLDASQSSVVELNSSTVKDPVPQIPLEPEKAEATQKLPDPKEEHFKFFCYRCGQRLKVPVSWANKSTPCGRCGHDLVVPPPLVEDS